MDFLSLYFGFLSLFSISRCKDRKLFCIFALHLDINPIKQTIMKKSVLMLVCTLIGAQLCFAQYTKDKVTVAIGELVGPYAETMRASAMGMMPLCRVNAVDIYNCNMELVDYIITGTVGEATVEPATSVLLGNYWSTKITYNLVMTDAKTGKIVATRDAYCLGASKDQSTSLVDAQKFQAQDMRRLVDKGCKVRVPVLTIESKKDKASTAMIDGGSTIGICDGLYFDVQVESEIAGKKIYKTIGAAKVAEVLGEEVTQVSITKGQKEIKKMFDEGIILVLTSKEEPMLHF